MDCRRNKSRATWNFALQIHYGKCIYFTTFAWFYSGGCAWFYLGGVRGFIWGGVHGFIWGGHAWFYWGGMHGFIPGGRAWFFQFFRIQWDTVNERAVRILLECILVFDVSVSNFCFNRRPFTSTTKYREVSTGMKRLACRDSLHWPDLKEKAMWLKYRIH